MSLREDAWSLITNNAGTGTSIILATGDGNLAFLANTVGYYARTSLDGPTDQGSTAVWYDASDGRLLAFKAPYGATPADALDKATRMLHVAGLWGWPYKVLVSFFGLMTAAMASAACVLWARRQVGRGAGAPA